MKLIDADAFKSKLKKQDARTFAIEELNLLIDFAPTIDAVPVVRCKDCKHSIDYYNDGECYCRHPRYNGESLLYIEDGYGHYCSFGERKDDD